MGTYPNERRGRRYVALYSKVYCRCGQYMSGRPHHLQQARNNTMRNKFFAKTGVIHVLPWRLAMACLLVLGVAACGDTADADATQGRTFGEALLEAPCELAPKPMLAELFAIPADEIRQMPIHVLGASCSSEWEGNDKTFSMEMRLQVFDTGEQAARRFAGATRSMTEEEMAAAAAEFKKHLGDGGDASDGEKKMTAGLLEAMAMQSTEYEDVAELGDEARFDVIAGELVTRIGN